MQSQALLCDENQRFTLTDVLLPDPGPKQILVRTLCSGVSIGTEFALIRNKISWGPYPLCTGYQGVGVVERAGRDVTGFSPGDKVYYRDNQNITDLTGRKISAVTGTHCRHAVIDPHHTHGIELLPEGVSDEAGSLFVMPAVGLYGVDMSNPRMGETVAVVGAGMVGLGVIAACAHRGCVVIAIDLAENRLKVAKALGADVLINASCQDVEDELRRITPAGADVVFESTGIPSLIDKSIPLCKPLGRFVWQGNYGNEALSMHFLPAHGRRLTMFFPCDDGLAPCRRAVLKNMSIGTLKWDRVITQRVQPEDAPALFDRINKDQAPEVIGAVIRWSQD